MRLSPGGYDRNPRMKTRDPTHADFAVWKEMRQALYESLDDFHHEEEMAWILEADYWHCLLAESEEGEIMGFLELSLRNIVDGCLTSPVGYIEGLYLKPQFRNSGHGVELISRAEEWCRSKGCREMATDSESGNRRAHNFFRREGFEETFTVVQFKKPLG